MKLEAVILRDTRGSQPAAATVAVGTLYCVTDEGNIVERSNGATWDAFGGAGTGDVVGPGTAADREIVRFDGTTGALLQGSGLLIPDGESGFLSGTNSGDVTLAGARDYLTISGQVITRNAVDLAADVSGRLPYANLTQSLAGSSLLGRGSGAGDWQDITLGLGLAIASQVLGVSIAEYNAGSGGAAKTIDWANGLHQRLTLTADCAITLTGGVAGMTYRLVLVQDGTGGWDTSWGADVAWEGGSLPSLTQTAGNITLVSLVCTGAGSGGYLAFATTRSLTL